MSKVYKFKSILINGPSKGVYADFPFDSRKEFGSGKPVRVKAMIEDRPYTLSLLPNGRGGHWLHLRKEIRMAVQKEEGDTVSISLERDTSPQSVEIPEYLQWLLDDDKTMAAYFDKLPFSAKKFWIGHIEEPKSDDAKVVRINRMFEFLIEQNSGK